MARIGVVVRNGVVLIDRINQLRAEGLSRHDAIVRGGGNRPRPILISACTTILSLVPPNTLTARIGAGDPPNLPMPAWPRCYPPSEGSSTPNPHHRGSNRDPSGGFP
jgi:hypothetical protein